MEVVNFFTKNMVCIKPILVPVVALRSSLPIPKMHNTEALL